MPTKKQRRRQQKARRHEYEYVYVDDEGNEVAVDPAELRTEKNGTKSDSGARRTDNRKAAPRKSTQRRAIDPPSWRRSARRALILGPILLIALMLLNPGVPLAQQIAPAIIMVAFFIPFSFFTDSLAYRMYRKRVERRDAPKTR
jgi:hypothetical protein